ncbi:MAG TPA: N,N-dimethylformamidase beta subunit family domain-containing protein [Conexibacter sp.]|jgi:N,N-dimethylformamidase|nr:N,N-dimethylformamidase beta subunit family domain-containing protein [Conexibacter sp.]
MPPTASDPDRTLHADILGYANDLQAAPGGRLRLHVSSSFDAYRARIVALDGADAASGWGTALDLGTHRGREQAITTGSCVVVPAPPQPTGKPLTLTLAVLPTLPADGRTQGLFAWSGGSAEGAEGLWLGLLPDGRPLAALGCDGGAARVSGAHPLRAGEWHRLTVAVDPRDGRLTLVQEALSPWLRDRHEGTAACPGAARWGGGPLTLAATRCSATARDGGAFALDEPFDGKLAQPRLATGAQRTPLCAWDLGGAARGVVTDRGPAGAHGFTVNTPASAVTGPDWDSREVDPRHAPERYDALHFHREDLDDARWEPDFELHVPEGCASGLYGVALEAGDAHDVVPFVVGPPTGTASATTAVWLPTYTWIAYANQRWSPAEALANQHFSLLDGEAEQPGDRRLDAHPELGLSLYDRHRDGSACRYSSLLRPIVNMRPEHTYRHTGEPREFTGELRFLQWLRARGRTVDLLTDADIDREGAELLGRYRLVVSPSHPEYVTYGMHRAIEQHVTGTGRLAYLGGNGLYWVTGVDPDRPHVIEVRRGHGATNPTGDAPPGESHLSTTGELGGLWRFRGRSPQRVLGVGMTAMGWGRGDGYAWTEEAEDERVRFVSEGIDRTQPLGAGTDAFPWGAAADEMDRADPQLGTPPNALVLASSAGRHDRRFVVASEDAAYGDGEEALAQLVRADVVYLESPAGGRVFSVGSMGWTAALWHAPDVARVTENVLDELGS